MISNGVLSTWKINSGWHKYTPKAVGYGSLNHPYHNKVLYVLPHYVVFDSVGLKV